MQYINQEITEEIANELLNTKENYYQEYRKYVSPVYSCGYGYYGCSQPFKDEDKWYVTLTIGDTCD